MDTRTANLTQLYERIDRATAEALSPELTPPDYSEAQRKAVSACVTGTVQPICDQVKMLHQILDDIQQQALVSAKDAEAALNRHIDTCRGIADEIEHMGRVISDLKHARQS